MVKGGYISPVQLLVGPSMACEQAALQRAQQMLCPKNGCTLCYICRSLMNRSHHHLHWLLPEKNGYTHDSLDKTLEALTYRTEDEQPALVVITRAEQLLVGTANRLLKLLEEPPHNVYFFLLTERKAAILGTIRSRCVEVTIRGIRTTAPVPPALERYCITKDADGALLAAAYKEVASMSAQETLIVLDALMLLLQTHEEADQRLTALAVEAYKQLPLPGNVAIFWKQFLAQCHMLQVR